MWSSDLKRSGGVAGVAGASSAMLRKNAATAGRRVLGFMSSDPKPTDPSFPFDVLLARLSFHSLPLDFQNLAAGVPRELATLRQMIHLFDLLSMGVEERAIIRRIRTPIGSWTDAEGRVGEVDAIEIDPKLGVVAQGGLSGLNIPPGSWVRLVPMLRWRSGRVSMRTPRWYGPATEPSVTRYTATDAPRGAVLAFCGFRLYVEGGAVVRPARSPRA